MKLLSLRLFWPSSRWNCCLSDYSNLQVDEIVVSSTILTFKSMKLLSLRLFWPSSRWNCCLSDPLRRFWLRSLWNISGLWIDHLDTSREKKHRRNDGWKNCILRGNFFSSPNPAIASVIITDGVARFFLSTIVPNSCAATENRTHSRVAPDWDALRSTNWATRGELYKRRFWNHWAQKVLALD